MPRSKILSDTEQKLFDRPPRLSAAERRRIFELPVAVWSAACALKPLSNRVGFLVSAGYFRLTRRFFLPSDFHDRDISYVAARLRIDFSDEKLRDSVGIPPQKIIPKSQANLRGSKA